MDFYINSSSHLYRCRCMFKSDIYYNNAILSLIGLYWMLESIFSWFLLKKRILYLIKGRFLQSYYQKYYFFKLFIFYNIYIWPIKWSIIVQNATKKVNRNLPDFCRPLCVDYTKKIKPKNQKPLEEICSLILIFFNEN